MRKFSAQKAEILVGDGWGSANRPPAFRFERFGQYEIRTTRVGGSGLTARATLMRSLWIRVRFVFPGSHYFCSNFLYPIAKRKSA